MKNETTNNSRKLAAKHTPTPWILTDNGLDNFLRTNDRYEISGGNFTIAWMCGDGTEVQANAEFIVRAVNSHEELLAAAKIAYEYIDRTDPRFKSVKEAIAKAEGTL